MSVSPRSPISMPVNVTQAASKAGALLRDASRQRLAGFPEKAEHLERLASLVKEKSELKRSSVSVVVLKESER